MRNNTMFLAVALFAVACQNGKASKSSSESDNAPVTIGVTLSEVESLSLVNDAIPQRGQLTCANLPFPFIQVAFVNQVATIIRDRSDTFVGNLDSCVLQLTQFTADGGTFDRVGGYGIGIDLFEQKDGSGARIASKLVRSGILLGLSAKSDCTTNGQDCTDYSANFAYSEINSDSRSVSNDLRVNQLSMSMEAETAATCSVSAKWKENAQLGGSPNLEIKLSSCQTLGGAQVQYGLNVKPSATSSASLIEEAHAIINNGQVRGSFSSSQTISLTLEEVQAMLAAKGAASTIFDALQIDFELAIRGAGSISASVYTLN